MLNDPRLVLQRLCAERGEDFAGLSRMLGKNPAYIQQYVRRGVPRRLGEDERRKLARYFGIAEALLGGPSEPESGTAAELVSVKRHPVTVSAGVATHPQEPLNKRRQPRVQKLQLKKSRTPWELGLELPDLGRFRKL